jgi:uncharacterized membrane protein SpoIIM required for sporulation
VILDVERFLHSEQPAWDELSRLVESFSANPEKPASVAELARFHYLYQRAVSSLARLRANAADPALEAPLESLVARAYGEIHQGRARDRRFHFLQWLLGGFPQTVRRHLTALAISIAITIAGAAFGAIALIAIPDAKSALMPFQHLNEKPRDRVQREEREANKTLEGHKTEFAADLMTHNIQVAVFAMALGMTWGVGTVSLIFYNGVTLGAVACDYVRDGQLTFLLGWLLPHGVIEIPAILVGGQAGLVLATALVGFRSRTARRRRLAEVRGDLASLAGGMGVMLVWAGVMEAFISQYHQPVLPYAVKIAMGLGELGLLVAWLSRGGRRSA